MSLLAYDPETLKTAVILADRPEVGDDSYLASSPLPSVVWLRASVVGVGAVRCAIEPSAVTTLSGQRAPTWGDLQAVWQTLASVIDHKIRHAEFDPAGRHRDRLPVVTIASADVRHHAQQPFAWSGAYRDTQAQPERDSPA
jgi:hypothetical protein